MKFPSLISRLRQHLVRAIGILVRILHWHSRLIIWLSLVLMVLAGATIGWLNYWALPNIGQYREAVAQAASGALGVKVSIDSLSGDWDNMQPHFQLGGVRLLDQQGNPALALPQVSVTVSWVSLVLGEVRLADLYVDKPSLDIRRDQAGNISLGGIPLNTRSSDGRFADWILAQHRIRITDARISWIDQQRAAPPLLIRAVDISLINGLRLHRFDFTGLPPAALGPRLHLSSSFRGSKVAHKENWSGTVNAEAGIADISLLQQWVHLPYELGQGHGSLKARVSFERGALQSVKVTSSLFHTSMRIRPGDQPIGIRYLRGDAALEKLTDGYRLDLVNITMQPEIGEPVILPAVTITHQPATGLQPEQNGLEATLLDLGPLTRFCDRLPLPVAWRSGLETHLPEGQLQDLKLAVSGLDTSAQRYNLSSRFQHLTIQAHDGVPGVQNASGRLVVSEAGGTLTLDSQDTGLLTPDIFIDSPAFSRISGSVRWARQGRAWQVNIDQLHAVNADAQFSLGGSYVSEAAGPGSVNIQADVTKARADAIWRYIPKSVGDSTRNWLKASLHAGTADQAHLTLRGNLANFPWDKRQDGLFQVDVSARGVDLGYARGWPEIGNINAQLQFKGNRMDIHGKSGLISGTRISRADVAIADLAAEHTRLTVDGDVAGRTEDFLRFVETSPLEQILNNMTKGARAQGESRLKLKLDIPLDNTEQIKVNGGLQFAGSQLDLGNGIPPLEQLRGTLGFTETGMQFHNLTGRVLGGPITADAQTLPDGVTRIRGRGLLVAASLAQRYGYLPLTRVTGSSPYQLNLDLSRDKSDLTIESNLNGIAVDLPAPLRKTAQESRPVRVQLRASAQSQQRWQVRYDTALLADLIMRDGGLSRGLIVANPAQEQMGHPGAPIGSTLPVKPGLWVSGTLPLFSLTEWLPLFGTGGGAAAGTAIPVTITDAKLATLRISGNDIHDVRLSASHAGDSWLFNIAARELQGVISWNQHEKGNDGGRIIANLQRASLPLNKAPGGESRRDEVLDQTLPLLDFSIDNLLYNERNMGKLKLTARQIGDRFQIQQLQLASKDGTLSVDGTWQHLAQPQRVDINLSIETDDIGRFLGRFGYADLVRRGNAKLSGRVSWNGSLINPDLATISGKLDLEAKNGQFAKIDPGVGRLLSIISLQSLSRRITLDFRDIFSEGMAFDTIAGKTTITRGVMTTDNLTILAPSVAVTMKGDLDIVRETQNLRVRVVPVVGEGVSIAAGFAINPVVGLSALLLQKAMRDPFGQLIAYEYQISGGWSDPKVEKLGIGNHQRPTTRDAPK